MSGQKLMGAVIHTAGAELRRLLDSSLPEGAEWDEREEAQLNLACRQADDIRQLELLLEAEGATVIGSTGQRRLNPVFAELRQSRLALSRILTSVRFADEGLGAPRNAVKQRAAQHRWDRVKQQREDAS